MKVLRSMKRALVIPAAVTGMVAAPVLMSGGFVSAVSSCTGVYWVGANTAYTVTGSHTPSGSDTTSTLTDLANWSTSSSGAYAAPSTLDAENLCFDVSAATTTTGTYSGAGVAGIEDVSGVVTIGSATGDSGFSASSPMKIAAGGTIVMDQAYAASTNSLSVPYITSSGAVTVDGEGASNASVVTGGGTSEGIAGPLTVEDTAAYVNGVQLSASKVEGYNITDTNIVVGPNVTLTLNSGTGPGSSDLTSPQNWTVTANGNGTAFGTVALNGAAPTSGNQQEGNYYEESFVGDGGIMGVSNGTATVSALTLDADSYASVPSSSDVLAVASGGYDAGNYTLSKAELADQGTFPGSGSSSSGGSSNGSSSGSGSSGSSSGSGSSTKKAPGTPDTGFGLTASRDGWVSMLVSALAAGGIWLAARRIKPMTANRSK